MTTETGWNDERLMEASDLIWAVMEDIARGHPVRASLADVLGRIEAADTFLVEHEVQS